MVASFRQLLHIGGGVNTDFSRLRDCLFILGLFFPPLRKAPVRQGHCLYYNYNYTPVWSPYRGPEAFKCEAAESFPKVSRQFPGPLLLVA